MFFRVFTNKTTNILTAETILPRIPDDRFTTDFRLDAIEQSISRDCMLFFGLK